MSGYFLVNQIDIAKRQAPDDKVTVHPNTAGLTTAIGYDQPHKIESTITANAIFLCLKKTIVSPAQATRSQTACLVSFFKKEPTLPMYKNMIATPTQNKAMTFGVHIPLDKGIFDPPLIAATRIAVARAPLCCNHAANTKKSTPTDANVTTILNKIGLIT
jgi:hypothetical protein